MIEFLNKVFNRALISIHRSINWSIYKEGVILYAIPKLIDRKKIKLGKAVRINESVFLHGAGGIEIKENVTLSYGTTILSTGYDTDNWDENKIKKIHKNSPITIEENVWVCANVTILEGVRVAKGSIIAAGSVVTNNLTEKKCLYGGIPARKIKDL